MMTHEDAPLDRARALTDLGNALVAQGDHERRIEPLRQAVAAYHEALKMLSREVPLIRAQASVALTLAIAETYCNIGHLLSEQNRLVEAEAAYRSAIDIKPDFANAHNNLSVTLKFLGRLKEARQSVERALQLVPNNASFLLNLTELKHFDSDDLAALQRLAPKLKTLPIKEQIDLHFALAKAYEDLGSHECTMQHVFAGNRLVRGQIRYDEASTLSELDCIAEVFTSDLIETFAGTGASSSLPVFIVGMPRSGTTLIEQILASHPQVFGGGELPTLNSLGGPIGVFADRSSVCPDVMANTLKCLGAHYLSEIARLAPHAIRITDKMPYNFRLAGLIHLALPNARIIHALRDPLDTCFSCFSTLFARSQYQTYDLAELARYYRHYQKLMEHWRRVLPPGRIMDVRYEDVVCDLAGQARRVVAHCGLEWDDRCLAFYKSDRPVHTASAVQVRQPIYRNAVGRAQPFKPYLQPLLEVLFTP